MILVKAVEFNTIVHNMLPCYKHFSEFLAPGAPCEINIDGKTMERTHKEMKIPSRFTFDSAAEHVYTLLLKKDCYPRFIRSEHYKNLLANGVQPSARRRYVNAIGITDFWSDDSKSLRYNSYGIVGTR